MAKRGDRGWRTLNAGAEAAFEQFYRKNERRVGRLLLGMLGDPALAADAAQDTWLRYLRYVDRPEPHLDDALLLTVARRPFHLNAPGGNKIPVIKVVREITGLGAKVAIK